MEVQRMNKAIITNITLCVSWINLASEVVLLSHISND